MTDILAILVAALFSQNFVLVKFLGICPFLGVSKKVDSALGMGLAVTAVMVLTCAVTYPIYTFILMPLGLEYMEILVFILVIACLVQMLEMLLKKFSPGLYSAMGVYLPLVTTNCAILGVTLLNVESGYTFVESMVASAGAGIGFLIAMVLFTGVRSTLEYAKPPKSFEGLPITLVAASLVAVSFMGFGGIIESLFGTF